MQARVGDKIRLRLSDYCLITVRLAFSMARFLLFKNVPTIYITYTIYINVCCVFGRKNSNLLIIIPRKRQVKKRSPFFSLGWWIRNAEDVPVVVLDQVLLLLLRCLFLDVKKGHDKVVYSSECPQERACLKNVLIDLYFSFEPCYVKIFEFRSPPPWMKRR